MIFNRHYSFHGINFRLEILCPRFSPVTCNLFQGDEYVCSFCGSSITEIEEKVVKFIKRSEVTANWIKEGF